jgi:hypothetical protein
MPEPMSLVLDDVVADFETFPDGVIDRSRVRAQSIEFFDKQARVQP